MTNSLARRSLLSGSAGIAAGAALILPTMKGSTHGATDPAATVVVRWDEKSHRWPSRPDHAEFGVVFLSTNDPGATPPTDLCLMAGDVWRLHPDAVAS